MTDPRTILISGSSRGIGLGIARYFLDRGHRVRGCSRSDGVLTDANYGHRTLDVADERAVRSWVASVAGECGGIDVAVCSAGIVGSSLMMSVTPSATFDEFAATHMRGTFLVCREVSKVMVRQRFGRIVNLSSPAVAWHLPGAAAYAATKAGVEEMTRVLATELAATGVTCNAIRPGLVMTDAARALGEERIEQLLARQTIRRAVSVDELCNVIEFLAAPASSAITGQTLSMCLVG